MRVDLKMALYIWHHRSGYTKEFSYPADFSIKREDVELLFFLVLGSKRRRIESLFSRTTIRDRVYSWYYFGANREEPAILVLEGESPEVMQLTVILALYLKLSNFKEIAPFGFKGLENLLSESKSLREAIFKLSIMNSTILNTLGLIYSRGSISFSDLVKDTIMIKPTPSIKDLLEIISILRWLDLIEMFYPEGESDIYITYRKLILILPRVNKDYLKKLRERLGEHFKPAIYNISQELMQFRKPSRLWAKMSELSKILFLDRYREIIEKIRHSVVLSEESFKETDLEIVSKLVELGVLSRFIGNIIINYEPELIIYGEKELENLGYL